MANATRRTNAKRRSTIPLTSVESAARYLCAIRDDEDQLTLGRLERLLYYAQGIALAVHGQPLFANPIIATANGPIIAEVERLYAGQIGVLAADYGFDVFSLPAQARAALERAYVNYGQYATWWLREKMRSESPWQMTAQGAEISHEALAAFFAG